MDKDLIKMRDLFKETAEILDEILELGVRSSKGEDIKKESDSALGRFMVKMVEMQSLNLN